MDTSEIEQKLNRLYNELNILETPWTNFVSKYHSLQSNLETANTEEAKQYYMEIISIQNKMKEIRDRIYQLENLFSEKNLPKNLNLSYEDAYTVRKAFEAPIYDSDEHFTR